MKQQSILCCAVSSMARPLRTAVAAALALILGATAARSDYTCNVGAPPYAVDRSIIGIGGWEYRLPTTEDHTARSRVVAVRWNAYKPAIMLKGANLKNTFPPTKSAQVIITFDVAFTFPDRGATGKQFRLGFMGAPMGEIFMDLGNEGGLGYQADGSGRGGIVVLKKADMKVNSFYRFIVKVDYASMKYEVAITGHRKDGAPFHFTSGKAPFESRAKNVSGLYLLSGASMTAYLGDVAVLSE
jgi:hypothetical protein